MDRGFLQGQKSAALNNGFATNWFKPEEELHKDAHSRLISVAEVP